MDFVFFLADDAGISLLNASSSKLFSLSVMNYFMLCNLLRVPVFLNFTWFAYFTVFYPKISNRTKLSNLGILIL